MSLRFRSQLQIDNLPDPQTTNRWEVIMPELMIGHLMDGFNKKETYQPIIEEINFAPLGFMNSQNIRAITTYYNVPIDKMDAKEANLTFYCDANMRAQYYIKAWRDMIFNEDDEFYYLPYQYKRDILVYFYDMGGTSPAIQFKLKGCYPLLQDDFHLFYSKQAKRLTINQKFNVDRVIISHREGSGGLSNGIHDLGTAIAGIGNMINPANLTSKLINSALSAAGVKPAGQTGAQQDSSYN